MKQRFLLLMMTALLSVGAWAQSLQTVTLFEGTQATTSASHLSIDKENFKGARVGSQLNIYYTITAQNNVCYFGNGWKSTWSNADGTSVSVLLDNDVISSVYGLDIHPADEGVTMTVTKVTLNYNGLDYLYNAESFSPNKYNDWNGALQLDLTNASVGDVLAISFSKAGGKLWFLSGQGDPEALSDVATLVNNASITGTTYTIEGSVFNDILVGESLEFTTNQNDIEATINTDGGAIVATNHWYTSATGKVTSDNIELIKTNGIKVTVGSGTTLTVKRKEPKAGRPTLYETITGYTTESPLYIPITETMKGYSGLYLSGDTYTASSVDLIYKSDVNIASVSNGTVVADMAKALESETVTLTVTPIANYELGTLTVTDGNSASVAVTDNGDGTYSFTMPATAVTVDATFTPTAPTALNTENIKLTKSVRSPELDGTVKLYIDGTETNGWDFTIGRPVSSTEFAGVEVKYKEAVNVQMVITYGDNSNKTQSFSAEEGSTNTAYITFDADKIVKSIKFGRVDTGSDGRIQFQSSSAVRLVGIVGASTYVPATSLTLTYETLEDGGGSSVLYDNTDSQQQFEIKSGDGHWAGWIFTLPIPTTLYKGVNFNMTSVPENGAIEIVYESSEPQTLTQTLKLSEGNNIVNFVHGGNITQIKFNVAGTYRMGECSASNTYLAKITDAKYATYCAVNDAIDYSSASGLKAYIAKVEAGVVKLTEVSKVPANTAVVLYHETAGTYTLSTATGTTDDVTANQLHISDGTVEGNGSTIYVLANKSKGVGFYLLTSGQKVLAGKAYLEVAGSGSPSFIGIGDDTTGIDEVSSKTEEVRSDYFDLQGRRVAQPTKGLYIVNGKKVIVK